MSENPNFENPSPIRERPERLTLVRAGALVLALGILSCLASVAYDHLHRPDHEVGRKVIGAPEAAHNPEWLNLQRHNPKQPLDEMVADAIRSHGLAAKTTQALTDITGNASSNPVDTFGKKLIRAQIWSNAGSTATVVVEESSDTNAPWYTVATITDPDATGEYWAIPRAYRVRLRVANYVTGTVQGNIEVYDD
jgi:hypothetical protein